MTRATLTDPVLDAKDDYTKLFLLAEYWKERFCKSESALAKANCVVKDLQQENQILIEELKEARSEHSSFVVGA